ncbi:sugar ABC transporter permease [Nonomuraea dietziae]|uniref:sugar ABC transporter permease n=1 Tax=Nonomuraea dietziae TaxID=65515 RepID=UPI0031DE1813
MAHRAASSPVLGQAARPATRAPRQPRVGFEGRMMTPGLILLAALSIVPFLALIAMSFSRVRLLGGVALDVVGLTNWVRFFTDADMWMSWLRTIVYFVLTVGLEMVLGIGIALCLYRVLRGRNILLGLLLLPMFAAPSIVGLLGRYLTDSTFGLYAWVLRSLGYGGDILGSPATAFAAVVLMDVWEWTPLIALITLAGLSSVPQSVREAAAVDGAGGWMALRYIIFPAISNVLLVALLIRRWTPSATSTSSGSPPEAGPPTRPRSSLSGCTRRRSASSTSATPRRSAWRCWPSRSSSPAPSSGCWT